ncbi:unnamed protein product [Thlaspi arvense]|uniref:Uncharacterized protein n=1 Tax=Thlaspi arvense TaxID=13288 RepID=A0AAU9RZH9_THLAR|nr:unnamed protein product [Thlaspi arvense]
MHLCSKSGCSDSQYFEEFYSYFTTEQAWKLCDPEAEKVFKAIKKAGVKVAILSNFDTRLRPLLRALRCEDWFDAVTVSAEVEAEKPNPTIFLKACCDASLWGSEVTSFKQVAQRIGVKV